MIAPNDIRIDGVEDRPIGGMWHTGPNPSWITITHVPSMQSVRLFTGSRSQHLVRNDGMAVLELLVEAWDGTQPRFPERVSLTPLTQRNDPD